MKSHPFAVLLAVALIVLGVGNLPVFAQTAPLSADTPSGPVQLSDADLQQLVAPIALYPDPMLALILQASTVPTDIVLANRWLTNGGDEDDIDSQPWDDSVKGLAHYPDVLQMMDDNLDWTNQLGAAVLAQQADVMRAVQAMRAKAQAQGNLQTTAQQQVVTQGSTIEIVPASPQVIYVPVYDPTVIYYQPAPPIVFGPSFTIGIWLGGGCNWNSYYFYRSGFYRPGYGWGYRPGYGTPWRPPPGRPPPRPPYRPGKPGGSLPGWRPPPGGGHGGGRPPGGGNPGTRPPGGSKPRPPSNDPNNPGRPGNGNGGGRPSIQPVPNPGGGNPGKPGKPGNGSGGGKPSIQPAPNPGGGTGKPNVRPPNGGSGGGNGGKPSIQPVKPAPQPQPKPSRPTANPRPSNPPPSNNFDRNRPSSKPHTAQPSAQPRPAPSQGGGGGNRGGGGNGGGNRGGGGGGNKGGGAKNQ